MTVPLLCVSGIHPVSDRCAAQVALAVFGSVSLKPCALGRHETGDETSQNTCLYRRGPCSVCRNGFHLFVAGASSHIQTYSLSSRIKTAANLHCALHHTGTCRQQLILTRTDIDCRRKPRLTPVCFRLQSVSYVVPRHVPYRTEISIVSIHT